MSPYVKAVVIWYKLFFDFIFSGGASFEFHIYSEYVQLSQKIPIKV